MLTYEGADHDEVMVMLLAMNMGGSPTEVMDALAAGRRSHSQHLGWAETAERLRDAAESDRSQGHNLSAAQKLKRAAAYMIIAERYLSPSDPQKSVIYGAALEFFHSFIALGDIRVERIDIPYLSSSLPALYVPAPTPDPAPVMIQLNGFDSKKEMLYLERGENLRRRDISLLIVDQPGTGEALRQLGLHDRPDAEVPVSACVDYLSSRSDVDPARVGVVGISMGGYAAPRAAAYEPRLACAVSWGAMYQLAVPVLTNDDGTPTEAGERFLWKFGGESVSELSGVLEMYTLDGVLEELTCPLLVTHGEQDRVVPVADAYRTYDSAVNSRRRDLRVFTRTDGTVEHCHMDNITVGIDFIDDWCKDILRGD